MEAGEGNSVNLKRQRTPLSDSEDNVLPPSEVNDDQKRRRLEAAGQENHSPQPSCSGRLTEQETKADTSMVLSVQSPVLQLTQRPEGGAPLAQRRLLDPGADGFRKYLLGEGEFNQRMECFKVPVFQAGPNPTLRPANPPPRTRSNLVSAVQQKLQGIPAPSSRQASHIRQERELSRLHFQPISENAWLKRSTSDPSLSKQIDGDAEMKDASFPGASTSHAEKQSSDGTGERAPADSEAPEESVELENSEGRLHMEWMEQSTHRPDKVREETGNEEKQLGTQQPQTQIVLKLSLSKDQSCSRAPFSEDQNVSELPTGDEQSLPESTRTEVDVSIGTEQGGSEMFSWEEIDGSSYSEEGIEPSTDEEVRSWRYPQGKVCKEEESIIAEEQEEDEDRQLESSRVEKENRGSVADHSEPSDIQDGECYWGNVSAEIAGSSEMQEHKKPRPEEDESESCLEDFVKDRSNLNRHILETEEMELDAVDERIEEERGDHDSGVGVFSGDKDKMDTESEKEKEDGESKEEEHDESKKLESNRDELLTFPHSGILSPLSESVEAVVTPLRLAASQESNPPSLLWTPGQTVVESAPLCSIDAYRTQMQRNLPTIQSVTPGVQRRASEKSQPQPSVNTKEKIAALNEEAGKLQTVINQTLQALSCCTDEHGRGSLEEAVAEKLLLVSCEKHCALLAEVARLREERNSESGEDIESGEDTEYVPQQACRGTVSITNIQLPLKVEFVCSSHNRTGRPSHYFFVLIRYGPCNIVATPLATAADAQNGDTISFPTSVMLKDIRSSFEIDVEVYSLSNTSGSNCSMDRTTTKSRIKPRKLLNTLTVTIQRSNKGLTSAALPALNARCSSNFCLVGSHKITLASLGHSKFPLDKMKLEDKIRRLLGHEFQEKVPFLSPLEGNIYLQLDSESHSSVQHRGFLTMFELISGYGVWHRRYFVLVGCSMHYWNHPNDKETKEAEGSFSLSSSPSRCVKPVKSDSCARPFTFELVSDIPQQQDASQDALAKCWFSADTKQERSDWMEKLNQVLLDFHTWNQTESQQSNTSSSGNLSGSEPVMNQTEAADVQPVQQEAVREIMVITIPEFESIPQDKLNILQLEKTQAGHFFVVEDDIREFTQMKADKRFQGILNMLRHCHRLRELRGGGITRYMLL